MGMFKQLLTDYCEAVHPTDNDAQDKLFEKLCDGTVVVEPEEMVRVIEGHKARSKIVERRIYQYQTNCLAGRLPSPQPKAGDYMLQQMFKPGLWRNIGGPYENEVLAKQDQDRIERGEKLLRPYRIPYSTTD